MSSPPMCGNGPSALIYPHASNPEAAACAREFFWTSGRQLEVTQPLSLPQHRCDLSVAGVQVREVTYFAQRNPTKSRDPFRCEPARSHPGPGACASDDLTMNCDEATALLSMWMRRVRSSPSFLSKNRGLASASTALNGFDREDAQSPTIMSAAAADTPLIAVVLTSSPRPVAYSR